jgi:Protein of unknown function (DUF2723)
MNFKFWNNVAGWLVFAITSVVFYYSIESTGSLWDCGEFVAGAAKLQVVHPPGAPLFLLIGRLFVWVGQLFSGANETAALSVNMMSGLCTAAAAMFIAWSTSILGKMMLVGRDEKMDFGQTIAACGAGVVGGLSSAFLTSNWFSAVEGEVYAMSTFFTCMTIWAIIKWYHLPNTAKSDRWIIFAIYASALSIGVHLLSLLTFPALALFYYFKKYDKHDLKGVILAGLSGIALVVLMQKIIVTGLPSIWGSLELLLVNSMGLKPMLYSTIILLGLIAAVCYFGIKYATEKKNALLQNLIVAFTVSVIGYSVIGMVVIRANANTPINMNQPSDPLRLLPYLNREQYGDRPLLRGPNFDAEPDKENPQTVEERYGRVGDHYEVVSQKVEYNFRSEDKVWFPRMGDYQPGRDEQYVSWLGEEKAALYKKGKYQIGTLDNIRFFFNYQLGWMYWRYFMWNFVGRENGEQGYSPTDKANGNWISGIQAVDEKHLFNQKELTSTMQNDFGRNKYYFLPLIFGLIGLGYHAYKRQNEFLALLGLFVITGIGIIVYTNQTPQEPRERDYVLVGSFFTFCIWIGLGAVALYDILSKRMAGNIVAPVIVAAALSAPFIMGTQNFDDHSRRGHTAARDYAANFLNSVQKNAIIFTYGDNDTYPLWYAQEVENIRPDVRVVNLSLIAVDWYIEQLRRKVNASDPIKLSISSDAYRGNHRDQNIVYGNAKGQEMDLREALKFLGDKHPINLQGNAFDSYLQTTEFNLPVDLDKMKANGFISPQDTGVVNSIRFSIGKTKSYIIKDDLAILDLVASNINDRPIYFAVTCQQNKLQGLQDYMQLEGLALRILPIKSRSDRQFNIIGNGRVDTKTTFDNITKNFRWGNFDTQRMFVDRSYAPSVQSHRLVMMRTGMALLEEGKKTEAADLMDTYFKAFPNMNFPYDASSYYMMMIYDRAEAYPRAKPHIEILAKNTLENLKFYRSIGDDVLNGFQQDYESSVQIMGDLIQLVRKNGDTAFADQLEKDFDPYNVMKGMKDAPQLKK